MCKIPQVQQRVKIFRSIHDVISVVIKKTVKLSILFALLKEFESARVLRIFQMIYTRHIVIQILRVSRFKRTSTHFCRTKRRVKSTIVFSRFLSNLLFYRKFTRGARLIRSGRSFVFLFFHLTRSERMSNPDTRNPKL